MVYILFFLHLPCLILSRLSLSLFDLFWSGGKAFTVLWDFLKEGYRG